jgi:hypothetical protein
MRDLLKQDFGLSGTLSFGFCKLISIKVTMGKMNLLIAALFSCGFDVPTRDSAAFMYLDFSSQVDRTESPIRIRRCFFFYVQDCGRTRRVPGSVRGAIGDAHCQYSCVHCQVYR